MKWDAVKSSNVAEIARYEEDLYVKFKNGNTYRYFSVPDVVYNELMVAESIGKYLTGKIKKVYTVEKINW